MTNLLLRKDPLDLIGSWHPRGFHGHSRAKSRIEFSNSYRESAKPLPPEKFRVRQKDDVLKHVFSKHDNKQIFLNDPLLFGSGFGKKKIDNKNMSRWNPEFITWSNDAGQDKFRNTMYQKDFCHISALPQKLLSNRKTIENRSISVYSMNFATSDNMNQQLKEIRDETYRRFSKINRSKSCIGERQNVASCLVWHDCTKRKELSESHYESKKNFNLNEDNVNTNNTENNNN